MKATIEDLQDSFKIAHEAYEDSRAEARELVNMYHNRQYTESQLRVLEDRGQPAETFNIIKLFSRTLIGYYATVTNTVKAKPVQTSDQTIASLLTDVISNIMYNNDFETFGDDCKLDLMHIGYCVAYITPYDSGEIDEFNRPLRDINIDHVPALEVLLDPMSTAYDYSDARFIHRYKWISEEQLEKNFPGAKDKLDPYSNTLNIDEAEFTQDHLTRFNGRYKVFDNYLVVHSIVVDEQDKVWSIYWSADQILKKSEVTYKNVRFPYRVQKLYKSSKVEHYGIFREVKESQKAINQALLKIQQMANTQKIFVEKSAVDDLASFTNMVQRVNSVIVVKKLSGIKVENLAREVLDQYVIIDKALERVKMVLSINDSFLGMAYASDSGRKVKLQQNATILALNYLTNRIVQFYRLLGHDTIELVKQYYVAAQALRVADELTGDRWATINQPLRMPTGTVNPATGEPEYNYVFEEVLDPATKKPILDPVGNFVYAPIPSAETDISFAKVDITIEAVAYHDEDEKTQLMIETVLSGNIGKTLAQVNPAGYFQASALALRTMKTKYSPELSKILEQTAKMLGASPEAFQEGMNIMQGIGSGQQSKQPLSKELKLPQNTNEGF